MTAARLVASLVIASVGFVATVTAPAGLTLTAAIITLAVGTACLANALADRWMP